MYFRPIKIQRNEIEFSDDPEYVLSNLIECVTLLDKVPEFLDVNLSSIHISSTYQRRLVN